MKKAKISDIKAKLSEYLRIVATGEEILVINHGRPVAKIVPLRSDKDEKSHEEWFEECVRDGKIRAGKEKLPAGFWDKPRPEDKDGVALKILLEDRRDGR